VKGDGLTTTVFPVMRAGAIFPALRIKGKFHGQMAPQTPNGVYCIPELAWGYTQFVYTRFTSV
jgi:hypothetical protein